MPDTPPLPPTATRHATNVPADAPRLRLSIAHLLLITAAIAAALSLHLGATSQQEASSDLLQYLLNLLDALLNAGALVGSLIFAFHSLLATRKLRPEPGHWLLILCAIDSFAVIASDFAASRTLNIHYFLWGVICGHGITACAALCMGLICLRERAWKIYFIIQAVLAIGTMIASTPALFLISFPWVHVAINAMEFGSIFTMAIYALVHRQLFRDWLHLFGIAITGVRAGMMLVSWLSLTPY